MKWFGKRKAEIGGSDEPLLLPAPLTVVEVGRQQSAVMNHLFSRVDWVPSHLVELVASCAVSMTPSETVANLQRTGFEEEYPGAFAAAVAEMRERQLLVSSDELVMLLRTQPDTQSTSGARPIEASVWCTCNRPELLLRSVASQYTAERASHRAPAEYWCFDDEYGDSIRGAVAAERQRSRDAVIPGLRLVSRTEKANLIDVLCKKTGPGLRSVVNFGLLASDPAFGSTIGANRNAALLLMAGRRFSALDDDIICRGFIDTTFDGVTVDGAVQPVRRICRGTELSAATSDPFSRLMDPVLLHQPMLGLSTREVCLRELPPEFVRLSRSTVSALAANAKVVVSSVGYSGVIASQPAEMLSIHEQYGNGKGLEPAMYRDLSTAGEIIEYVPRATITSSARFTAGAFALDQTELMPPFSPLGRRQDAVFGMLVTGLWNDRLIAHVPAALEHRPSESRTISREAITEFSYGANDLLMMVIRLFEPRKVAGARAEQLMRLGSFLIALCDDHRNWNTTVLEAFRAGVQQHLKSLYQSQDSFHDAPNEWISDAEARIANLERAVNADAVLSPIEYLMESASDDWMPEFRRYARNYGELVYHWPEIWEAARELREAGKLNFAVI